MRSFVKRVFSFVALLAILLPQFSFAQFSGGGYVMTGSANPVTGLQSGGGYTNVSGGNPAAQNQISGGGFILNAGSFLLPSYSQASYYSQGSYGGGGGGGGGGGIIQIYTFPTTTSATGTISLVAASSTMPLGGGASCSIATQFMPKTYIRYGAKNTTSDVKALQLFLNAFEGFNLKVDGIYKKVDRDSVITFQERHAEDILSPWGFYQGTGYLQRTSLGYIQKLVKSQCTPVTGTCLAFAGNFQRGDRDDEILLMQNFLKKELGVNFTPNGYFGPATESAVRQFQTKYKSEVLTPAGFTGSTGKWFAATRNKANKLSGCDGAIVTKPATPALVLACQPFTKNYEFGGAGTEVQRVQQFLNKELGINLQTTGYFGEGTRDAVINFQEKYFNEILIANGYSKGTGMWFEATRNYANGLLKCDTAVPEAPQPAVVAPPTPRVSTSQEEVDLKTCPVFNKNYEFDNAGPEVQKIQAFLNKELGLSLQTNGYFGEGTKAGVRQFQEQNRDVVLQPDGFTKGTGMWYPRTREWANLLLGCN